MSKSNSIIKFAIVNVIISITCSSSIYCIRELKTFEDRADLWPYEYYRTRANLSTERGREYYHKRYEKNRSEIEYAKTVEKRWKYTAIVSSITALALLADICVKAKRKDLLWKIPGTAGIISTLYYLYNFIEDCKKTNYHSRIANRVSAKLEKK